MHVTITDDVTAGLPVGRGKTCVHITVLAKVRLLHYSSLIEGSMTYSWLPALGMVKMEH